MTDEADASTRMIFSIPVKDEVAAKRVEQMRTGMRADQVAQFAVALASGETADVSGQIFVARGNAIINFPSAGLATLGTMPSRPSAGFSSPIPTQAT